MGFFKKIKDLFKKTILSKELPEPKKIKIKTKVKKILSDYHHIIKIYWVKENDIIDDSQIEIMIDWIKEHKTRYDIDISANNPYEPNLVKMFFKVSDIFFFLVSLSEKNLVIFTTPATILYSSVYIILTIKKSSSSYYSMIIFCPLISVLYGIKKSFSLKSMIYLLVYVL